MDLNSHFIWTKIFSSLGLTLGPILRPQQDPYRLFPCSHTPPIFMDPNSLLFWTERISSLIPTLGPILRPQQDPYRLFPFSHTPPVAMDPNFPLFGPKNSSLLDSNWHPYCVPSRTHTDSFLYLKQLFVKDPNSPFF